MSALLIGYDLNKPGQNFDKLYEKIKQLGTWLHYLDSTWIVVSSLTPGQDVDRLKPTLDDSDDVLIVNITGDTYSGWLPQEAWDWLRKHVKAPDSRLLLGLGSWPADEAHAQPTHAAHISSQGVSVRRRRVVTWA